MIDSSEMTPANIITMKDALLRLVKELDESPSLRHTEIDVQIFMMTTNLPVSRPRYLILACVGQLLARLMNAAYRYISLPRQMKAYVI